MRNYSSLARNYGGAHARRESAGVGARESASRTYLRDGTRASAIFHYSRKVRGGCVHSAKSGRHPPQKLLSRGHNSPCRLSSWRPTFFSRYGLRIAAVIVYLKRTLRAARITFKSEGRLARMHISCVYTRSYDIKKKKRLR